MDAPFASQAPTTLFLVHRKGKGIGGMQQLNRDLTRGFEQIFGKYFYLLQSSNSFGLIVLPLRVLLLIVRAPKNARVHFCDASLAPLGALLKIFRKDLRITLTACGLDVLYTAAWYQWLLRVSFPRIDYFASISHATAELLKEGRVLSETISVIPCGVWKSAQALGTPEEKLLLTVGRLVPRKGVLWFLENVFPKLLEKHPAIHYSIVGDGVEKESIVRSIAGKNLTQNVSLHGAVSNSERDDLYSRATLFVMPNIELANDSEGFGIVALEAGQRGVPVVAARTGGIPDAVIPDVTGILFESGNSERCSAAIEQALQKNWDRQAISHAVEEQYDWEKLLPRYVHEVFAL